MTREKALRDAIEDVLAHSCSRDSEAFDYHSGYADGYHSARDQIAESLRAMIKEDHDKVVRRAALQEAARVVFTRCAQWHGGLKEFVLPEDVQKAHDAILELME